MNRSLTIPAAGCLCAFGAVLAALYATSDGDAATADRSGRRGELQTTSVYSTSRVSDSSGNAQLSIQETKQLLTALSDDYLRPWRQWESSPRRLYSRVAPRPIPPISAFVDMSPTSVSSGDSFRVATIVVTTGDRSQSIPCVVDRITRRVRLFADGRWLTEEEWVQQAPLPGRGSPG